MTPQLPDPSWHRGYGPYVAAHPTLYGWREDVRRVALWLLGRPGIGPQLSVNTYRDHPPGWHRDTTSLDVWSDWGRGGALTDQERRQVFALLFNKPGAPYIDWIISGGAMWTRRGGWQGAPPGPVNSDPGHWRHVHVTYL